MKHLVVILYDGIENSVFAGQVLQPLVQKLEIDENIQVHLISFERRPGLFEKYKQPGFLHERLRVTILKKYPFIGSINLWHATRHLEKVLSPLGSYECIARGPIAGAIALRVVPAERPLIIQARGLLAEEYTYMRGSSLIHRMRAQQFRTLEKDVYSTARENVTIEAVSSALKNYLIKKYGTRTDRITVAQHDIPQQIKAAIATTWKQEVRTELKIPADAHVYCYSGSSKPWQCPDMVVHFFQEKFKKEPNTFLLILTQDTQEFKTLLGKAGIPEKLYHIATVAHHEVYRYLSACNTGLIFRKNHMVNWVARPTKVLEYRAAGLDIVHNNTVAYLTEK